MGFRCGIVGLPNVGKSTLFNALTSTAAAQAANYPFCTIEPNIGKVAVPDSRLEVLAALAKSERIIPTQIEFVDIAGLVKGASKGEGLGNQFLSHIREVDVMVEVLRCFEDGDITHVEGSVNPVRDAEIVELELVLADLESLEKRLPNIEKKAKTGDKEAKEQLEIIEKVLPKLREGKFARTADIEPTQMKTFQQLQLLTSKAVLYVCNVAEFEVTTGNKYTEEVKKYAASQKTEAVIISARIEEEIANLPSDEDKKEFLGSLGLEETGLNKIIHTGYKQLGLTTFFTVGPKEARAWTVRKNALAPEAAGVIHTDFEKGFIKAETIAFADYVAHKGEAGARDAGKLRQEGKEYSVKDGDVFHFKFNV